MKHEINNKNEDKELLDILLDEDNVDPIILFDDTGKRVAFEQVAIIPMGIEIYCVLKPLDEMEGVADDEALVFRVDEKDGAAVLVVETDEPTAHRVFEEYYNLVDEQS